LVSKVVSRKYICTETPLGINRVNLKSVKMLVLVTISIHFGHKLNHGT